MFTRTESKLLPLSFCEPVRLRLCKDKLLCHFESCKAEFDCMCVSHSCKNVRHTYKPDFITICLVIYAVICQIVLIFCICDVTFQLSEHTRWIMPPESGSHQIRDGFDQQSSKTIGGRGRVFVVQTVTDKSFFTIITQQLLIISHRAEYCFYYAVQIPKDLYSEKWFPTQITNPEFDHWPWSKQIAPSLLGRVAFSRYCS